MDLRGIRLFIKLSRPIFLLGAFFETMVNIEKFSIPQVSGIHIVPTFVLDKILEHSKIWSIERREPRLHAILIEFLFKLDILVFLR